MSIGISCATISFLADVVGLKIKQAISPSSCVADGWGYAGIHYFAVLHQWPVRNTKGKVEIKEALLSCQPLVDQTSLTAKLHTKSIRATYQLYMDKDKDKDNKQDLMDLVVCLTLDNCSTNNKFSCLLQKPMIGAYYYQLNLATEHWINQAFNEQLMTYFESTNTVMICASSYKARGKLAE